ncbi:CASP-like protein 4D1 [Fagus crenata]
MALLPRSHIAILSLRGLSLVFPLISLLLLANNSSTYEVDGTYRFAAFESYSAASAGIGASRDIHEVVDVTNQHIASYISKGFAAACLLLPAFVCTAILSIISSYAVPKKV